VAVPVIERALDLGVNYLDTSSIYGGPERWSERYIGQVMKKRRAEAFLASKTKERTRDQSLRMLEQSLKLLQTDHLDLWQLHDVGTMGEVSQIFGKGGAMEALTEARDQKMVRFLGLTGHFRPDPLMEAMRRFSFDCILMVLSAADPHHFSFKEQLLPMAVEKQVGIIGMKIPGRGRLLSSWTPPPLERQKNSWEGVVLATRPGTLQMREALYYTLSHPVSTVIIGCDSIAQLEENVQLAREFTPLSDKQMAALQDKAEPVSKQALFFRFFDRAQNGFGAADNSDEQRTGLILWKSAVGGVGMSACAWSGRQEKMRMCLPILKISFPRKPLTDYLLRYPGITVNFITLKCRSMAKASLRFIRCMTAKLVQSTKLKSWSRHLVNISQARSSSAGVTVTILTNTLSFSFCPKIRAAS